MPAMPCPHSRYHWTICPHCNGTNDAVREQIEIEAPNVIFEIIETEDDAPPPATITHIEI